MLYKSIAMVEADYVHVPQSAYKIILAGMKGVGKTTLLNMLNTPVDVDFGDTILKSLDYGKSSRGRTKITLNVKCDDTTVKVEVWDTGDMETHSGSLGITRSYFRDATGVILIYERNKPDSINDLRQWLQLARAESPNCVLSLWCNNRTGEFGMGSQTRDLVNDIVSLYKIPQHLNFVYTSERDVSEVHEKFSRLVSEVYSKRPANPQRNSIRLDQAGTRSGKKWLNCCLKN